MTDDLDAAIHDDPIGERFGPLASHLFEEGPLAEIWRMSFLSNSFTGPLYSRLHADYQLGRPGFVILYCLSQQDGLMARDVVRASGLPKNSVSRAATDLITEGLVVADADSGDRRTKPLRLTSAGRDLLTRLMPSFEARQTELTAPLSDAERRTLQALLRKMAQHLPTWVDD